MALAGALATEDHRAVGTAVDVVVAADEEDEARRRVAQLAALVSAMEMSAGGAASWAIGLESADTSQSKTKPTLCKMKKRPHCCSG